MIIKQTKRILFWPAVLVIGLVFGSALQIALAWTVPSATPPGNNVAPPLNTSAVDQAKVGSLTVSGAGERMQASKFIDNDNTNFFLDPNSSSKLSFATFDNLESLGFVSANRMVTSAYMQAPVFYDNNNINYKLDPNGLSRIEELTLAGTSQWFESGWNQINSAGRLHIQANGDELHLNPWAPAGKVIIGGGGSGSGLQVAGESYLCEQNIKDCKTWLSDDGYIEDSNDGFLRLRMKFGGNFDVTGGDICTDKGGSWHCLSTASGGLSDCATYWTGWHYADGTEVATSCPSERPNVLNGGCDSGCLWLIANYNLWGTQHCNTLSAPAAAAGGMCIYAGQQNFRAFINCCK